MRQMRKVFAVMMGCLCLAVLSGCNNPDEAITASSEIASSKEVNSTSSSSSDSDMISANSENKPTETASTEKNTVSLGGFCHAFSEGIAWVDYRDSEGEKHIGWLHPNGMIDQPFPVETITDLAKCTEFSAGYSYYNNKKDSKELGSFIIINQSGDITAESPKDGNSYEILCGGDGVYLVKQSVRSMTENEDRYGFISGNGTWISECIPCEAGGNHPLSLNLVPDDEVKITFTYLGEGVFKALYTRGDYYSPRFGTVLYNIYTGENYVVDSKDNVFGGDPIDTVDEYSDGWIPTIDGNLISSDFEKKASDYGNDDNLLIYGDGILFIGEEHVNPGKTYITNGRFLKNDGALIADLSQYELIYENGNYYHFSDGYAAVIIHGADGGYYLGIIDMKGEFTFEPIEVGAFSKKQISGPLSNGAMVYRTIDDDLSIIDVNGNNVSTDIEGYNVNLNDYVFSEDYCFCFKKDSDSGEYKAVYVAKDGSELETYTE